MTENWLFSGYLYIYTYADDIFEIDLTSNFFPAENPANTNKTRDQQNEMGKRD